jgi:DNA-binding CsgD family transcriptional regulator
MLSNNPLARGLIFSCYVFWLISFPMKGPLKPDEGEWGLVYFLLPHTVALFLAARGLTEITFAFWSRVAVVITVFLTLLFPASSPYAPIFLGLLGLAGAPVAIRAVGFLKGATNPALATGLGLAAGNFLVFLGGFVSLLSEGNLVVVSLALLPLMFPPLEKTVPPPNLPGSWKKPLPLIFVFYIVGGIYYGFLAPRYDLVAIVPGAELFFYLLAALLGIYLVGKNRELPLVAGIMLGAFSFALFAGSKPLLVNLSVFAGQASFALVDLYLILTLISRGGTIRIIGSGLGVMCLAILAGKVASLYALPAAELLVMGGKVALIVAVLVLYLTGDRSLSTPTGPEKVVGATDTFAMEERDLLEKLSRMEKPFQKRISPKEREVLTLIVQGKTYREAGEILGVSESSVKTYMTRIYEKLGVRSKDELFKKLSELP